MKRPTSLVVIGAVVLAVAVGLALQRQSIALLRSEVEWLQEERRRVERQRSENERLLAAQPPAEVVARQAAVREEIGRMEADVLAMRAVLEKTAMAEKSRDVVARWSVGACKNAGRATPAAVLETAAWAAMEGSLDALAAARAVAEKMLAGLPEESRANYRTPERLIALFTAKDVPFGEIELLGLRERNSDEQVLRVRLLELDGRVRMATLTTRREPGGWKFVVPERAVERYAAMLRAEGE